LNHQKLKNFQILLATIVLIAAFAFILLKWNNNEAETSLSETVDSLINRECHDEFGIATDGQHVVKGKIQPNQFLADILLPFGINYAQITHIAEKSKSVFDIRKLVAGKNYTLICSNDPDPKAEFFIYEASAVDFVVFNLRDTMSIYRGSRPTSLELRTASGVIHSSLYQTLVEQDLSPALAMEMADIYAWTIDFYRIQKGDYFKLMYTVKKVQNQVVGIDEVKAALFSHYDNPYYAFLFKQDEGFDYFDEAGNSLRKAFLQAPLKFSRISSGYTQKRFHPVQKRWKAHLGTDYAAPTGTPIMSVGDGIVVEATYKTFNGNYVKVKHNSTYTTQYLHMSKIATGIKPGVRVKQGETIGYIGSTGLATGPHVCFRFWKNGIQIDHRQEKIPPSEPIKSSYRGAYDQHLIDWKDRLDDIPLYDKEKPNLAAIGN
jgi:murein DD-endopeptidase MepM/ murein hydrolase activator NlpD